MINKDEFLQLIREQPAEWWARGFWGFTNDTDAHHCKIGYVGARKGVNEDIFPLDFIVSYFDLTVQQYRDIVNLNDNSKTNGEAIASITAYVESL